MFGRPPRGTRGQRLSQAIDNGRAEAVGTAAQPERFPSVNFSVMRAVRDHTWGVQTTSNTMSCDCYRPSQENLQ